MATDATGTPSSNYAIPKFNTVTDAPSGKGTNAIVDAIDAVIPFAKTLVTTKGDLPVVTGAGTFARLAVGSDGQLLTADSASVGGVKWSTGSAAGYGTSLPGSPTDGQLYILVDSTSAPTYQWTMRYNSTASKWYNVGGYPKLVEVLTSEGTSSTSFVDLTTVGPSFTAPVAGVYEVRWGALLQGTGGGGGWPEMGIKIGSGAITSKNDTVSGNQVTLGPGGTREKRFTAAASDVIKAQYRENVAGSMTAEQRWMQVLLISTP